MVRSFAAARTAYMVALKSIARKICNLMKPSSFDFTAKSVYRNIINELGGGYLSALDATWNVR
jgi:hypothetical protein